MKPDINYPLSKKTIFESVVGHYISIPILSNNKNKKAKKGDRF
jgi:hypothetical protein